MIDPDRYHTLTPGDEYMFSSFCLRKDQQGKSEQYINNEYGFLIRCTSKSKETKNEKGEWTGKFETRGDTVVYIPTARKDVQVTIGCGLFGVTES